MPTLLPALVALAVLVAAPAVAEPPPGGPPTLPKIPQIELTDGSARGAIDAFLTLRGKYGDEIGPVDEGRSVAEGLRMSAEVQEIVGDAGFSDAGEWQRAITSVVMAYGVIKGGKGADLDAKIAEMEANPQIPPGVREQMAAMLRGLRPSEQNLATVRRLMADPKYGEALHGLAK